MRKPSQALRQFVKNLAARERHPAGMDQLNSLSDFELEIIGLTRADVRARHAEEMEQLNRLSNIELEAAGMTRADVRALRKDQPNG